MSRAGDEDCIEMVLLDEAVHVDVGKTLAGVGALMAQQPTLDVLEAEWFFEEGIVFEEVMPKQRYTVALK